MSDLSNVFTREILTTFLEMPANEWRALTCAVGTLYRTRLTHPEYVIDRVAEVFGDNVPPREQWNTVKDRVNKLRRQAALEAQRKAEASGAIPEDQTAKFKKREYQRTYMRNLRAQRKQAASVAAVA
jgi:hypothetical protein